MFVSELTRASNAANNAANNLRGEQFIDG